MSVRRLLVAFGTLLVVAGLVLGLVTGLFGRLGRDAMSAVGVQPAASAAPSRTSSGPTSASSSATGVEPTSEPGPSATAATAAPEPKVPDPVLQVAGTAQRASARRIRGLLAQVDRKGLDGVLGAAVSDSTGRSVYATNAQRPLTPASTMKLLTGAAALSLFGPHHRFTTKVVAQSPRQIVLVGGGDPYLAVGPPTGSQPARASLTSLAAATATKLRLTGRRSVALGYDDTLFSGPAWNPLWPTRYSDQVGRTTALAVRPKGPDSARSAAGAFAAALRKQGITVGTVSRVKASRGAVQLAAGPSMTVSQIVTQLLLISDNSAAEVMLRHIGLQAGRGGSIAGGRRALRAELEKLGVWTAGAVTYDGSGLARESRIPPGMLVELLSRAAEPKQVKLRSLLTGLPVAGVEGSLRTRFTDPTMDPAEGVVRGKTGTLTGVRSLAGYLRTPDGTLLYYAVIINEATDDYAAGEWIQRALTALSTCRCRA